MAFASREAILGGLGFPYSKPVGTHIKVLVGGAPGQSGKFGKVGRGWLARAAMLSTLDALDLEASAPPSFCCPIGRDLMHDPVSCADGHSYEREHITRWLSESRLSPVTGAPLPSLDLMPNHALRNAIEEWTAQQQPPPPQPEADPAVPPPSMWKSVLLCHSSRPGPPGADLATLRARGEPTRRSGSNGRLRFGRATRPKSPPDSAALDVPGRLQSWR